MFICLCKIVPWSKWAFLKTYLCSVLTPEAQNWLLCCDDRFHSLHVLSFFQRHREWALLNSFMLEMFWYDDRIDMTTTTRLQYINEPDPLEWHDIHVKMWACISSARVCTCSSKYLSNLCIDTFPFYGKGQW